MTAVEPELWRRNIDPSIAKVAFLDLTEDELTDALSGDCEALLARLQLAVLAAGKPWLVAQVVNKLEPELRRRNIDPGPAEAALLGITEDELRSALDGDCEAEVPGGVVARVSPNGAKATRKNW